MVFADIPAGLKDEIVAALKEAKTAIYREGSTVVYLSRYVWRQDTYNEEVKLRKTEWFAIEKEDMGEKSWDFNDKNYRLTQTIVNFEKKTYTKVVHRSDSHPQHPMDRILFLAGNVNLADRMLENTNIEGIECFGLELSAKKYGTNPDGMLHRLWFNVETKLPVRMELEWLGDGGNKSAIMEDQFEWNVEVPAEIFTSQIPPDFTFVEPDQM
jgi:outer membrane lipoprotein-sorting protein